MAVSKVDICNKALLILGAKPIAVLTEPSNNAIQLNRVYGSVRDTVLRAHSWGFATAIESLGQLSGETVPGWTYLYASPSMSLKINKVFSDTGSSNPDPIEYREVRSPTSAQKAIACKVSPAYIDYTFLVDDPSLYSADFVASLAMALAAETAFLITGDKDMGAALAVKYGQSISEAKRNDASGKNVDPTAEQSSSSYETARA